MLNRSILTKSADFTNASIYHVFSQLNYKNMHKEPHETTEWKDDDKKTKKQPLILQETA